MILLYPSTETEFQNNGLGALSDAISCTVTEERNGMYELEMQYPVSGSHYGEIANLAILFCKPDPSRDPQPSRIYRILKPISGRVTVYAQHISYDLSGVTVSPFSSSRSIYSAVSKSLSVMFSISDIVYSFLFRGPFQDLCSVYNFTRNQRCCQEVFYDFLTILFLGRSNSLKIANRYIFKL